MSLTMRRVSTRMQTDKKKQDRINEGLGVWTAFYRANPHRFAIDYLGMTWMTPIQQVILNVILKFTYAMIIASRGFGKTMLVAAAICIRAILYPHTEIVIAAGNRGQSLNVLNKIIDQFLPASQNLHSEIANYKATTAEAFILFKNGSIVKVVTARDSSRSARANWVICDEFVQIKKTVIDSVLRKFKAGQRRPGFYDLPEYKDYPREPNMETYISSAFYKYHYSWAKFKSFFKSMIKGESYTCMGFPYQMAIQQGYYPIEQVREEMQEDDFDSIKFSMEMLSLFFGEASNAFYSYTDMEVNRNIEAPIYPPSFYQVLGDPKLKYRPKENGEIRLVSMDVATQGGSKNDNSCFSVLSLKPTTSLQYERSLIYIEVLNGGHTQDQALRLRQLYDDFEADFVVVDTNGRNALTYSNVCFETQY
ncbi:MAG: terminase family protein [Bacteroidales bacterium]|nr:terminase family protein [Bacteroidales bacterium]